MVILNGEQCLWIPNVLILLLQSQVFPDQGYSILQKLGDDCPCEYDVPSPMGWGGHHINCAQYGGEFLKKTFWFN
jgi:hypothetical protein